MARHGVVEQRDELRILLAVGDRVQPQRGRLGAAAEFGQAHAQPVAARGVGAMHDQPLGRRPVALRELRGDARCGPRRGARSRSWGRG